jgi:hypothetical protein
LRIVVLTLALAFIGVLAVLTAIDFSRYGVTVLGVLAVLVLVLFIVGILGALLQRPRR